MRNQLVKDKEFYIISRSIDNASKCKIIDVSEDSFKVELNDKVKYEVDESVELFTMTDNGQLYFETIVKDVEDNILSIWFPIDFKYLQRREYSRINIEKEIELNTKERKIKAEILDISAGGLKISAKEPLELLKEYIINLTLGNHKIACTFQPIRTEALQGNFIVSGSFCNINNYDRIVLVQYCFRKLIENSNK